MRERCLDELAHRARLARRQHVVVGRLLLQDAPHALDVVARMAPIALGVEVAEVEAVLEADLHARHSTRDLACHERLAADRALVVEQDAVRGVHAVGFAIVHRDPVAVQLGDGIGAARIERRRLLLRHLLHEAVELRRRGLVEAARLLHAEDAQRLEQAQHADGVGVGGVLRALERHGHVALGGEIVDLGRAHLLHETDQVG